MSTTPSSTLFSLATELGVVLTKQSQQLTCAESCTGGGIAQAVTSVPGSSQWFEMGFITYSDRAKHQLLAVPSHLLKEQGAVSGPVVTAMAEGALEQANATISVATTGIAGPSGGSDQLPVGTVFMAWASTGRKTKVEQYHFEGSRHQVQQAAIQEALTGLLEWARHAP